MKAMDWMYKIVLLKNKRGEKMEIKGKKILVVEDNEINMEILTEMLISLGLEMEGVYNGQEAVDRIANAKEGDFHVVLMDIHMPIMDGYEATKIIRSRSVPLCNIPVLALTGDSFAEDKKQAKEVGMNGFIAKPVSLDRLSEEICDVLSEDER